MIELPQETQEIHCQHAPRRRRPDQGAERARRARLPLEPGRRCGAGRPQPRRVNEAPTAASFVGTASRSSGSCAGRRARAAEPNRQARPAPPTAAPERSTPPRREAKRAPPAGTSAGRGGWLSDLLNRASRDDDQPVGSGARTPQRQDRSRVNSLESLDSISVDIARMIDHDAAVELWDRYKRGERNVFTRRLYTLQGQQTFEEIRAEVPAGCGVQQTVDRYVEEFERLLAEVSRDDRDSMLAKTYLTSETGKVYTMLAHASGRLD